MKGPTMRRRIEGSARRTVKPPRSRVRGRITVSTGEAASRSANGSSGIVQLIEASLRSDAGEPAALLSEHLARQQEEGARVAGPHAEPATQPVPLREMFGGANVHVADPGKHSRKKRNIATWMLGALPRGRGGAQAARNGRR